MAATAAGEIFRPERLEDVPVLREILDRVEGELVLHAREVGYSWTEIGVALGVSRQSAHRKHAARIRAAKTSGD